MNIAQGIFLLTILIVGHAFPSIWPRPISLSFNSSAQPLYLSPCDVGFTVSSPLAPQIHEIIAFYRHQVFRCKENSTSTHTLTIAVSARSIEPPISVDIQKYSLFIRKEQSRWQLFADHYVGFLRGIETFSQLFEQQRGRYIIQGIPIVIDDQPAFKWRGLMIDTSRHFLPLSMIRHTIKGLLFNKMNVLHWHIVDQDSFPFEIPTVPELNTFGKVGGSYSPSDIQEIQDFAKKMGVRVVVEIDTPGHTESWGRSDKYKDIIVKCDQAYDGQLDPTNDLTYEVIRDVFSYANSVFDDPYIHFGGDQVDQECWDVKPSIKEWMKKNNISDYEHLQRMYRLNQKKIWRNISKEKKVIYWANQESDLPVESQDAIQWWGQSADLNVLVGRPNQIILSNYDQAYLDVGFGDDQGDNYRTYVRWRQIYDTKNRMEGINIIGAQTAIWSQLNNLRTHDQKVWIRTSALAERFWNEEKGIDLSHVAHRLAVQAHRMKRRGFKVSSVTVQLCEQHPTICF